MTYVEGESSRFLAIGSRDTCIFLFFNLLSRLEVDHSQL